MNLVDLHIRHIQLLSEREVHVRVDASLEPGLRICSAIYARHPDLGALPALPFLRCGQWRDPFDVPADLLCSIPQVDGALRVDPELRGVTKQTR